MPSACSSSPIADPVRILHYIDRGIASEEALSRAEKARSQRQHYHFRDARLFDPRALERADAVYAEDNQAGRAILEAYEAAGVPKHDLRSAPSERESEAQALGPAETTVKGAVRPRVEEVADNPSTDGDDTKPVNPPEVATKKSAKK